MLSSQPTSRCEPKAQSCVRSLPTRSFCALTPQIPSHPSYLLSSLCFCLSIMTGFGGGWNFVGSRSLLIRQVEEENHPVKIKRSEKRRSQKEPFPTASQPKPPPSPQNGPGFPPRGRAEKGGRCSRTGRTPCSSALPQAAAIANTATSGPLAPECRVATASAEGQNYAQREVRLCAVLLPTPFELCS